MGQLVQKTKKALLSKRIELIPLQPNYTYSELKKMFPNKNLCVCDFYIKGCETGSVKDYGIEYENILIIDHHAPIKEMQKHISSGTLAANYIKQNDSLDETYKIIINHCDCDSIISMLIMAGIIKPEKKFLDAVIAADHTGKKNKIADFLQSTRRFRDIERIVKNFENLLLEKEIIDNEAKELYDKWIADRNIFEKLVKNNEVHYYKNVAYVIHDRRLDPTHIIGLLPNYDVIMIAYPSRAKPGNWNIRLRLGINTRGISLNELNLLDFGGRWNAGSNRRTGGSDIDPHEYAKHIAEKIS